MENDVLQQQVQEYFDQERRNRAFVVFLNENEFVKKVPDSADQDFKLLDWAANKNDGGKTGKGLEVAARLGLAAITMGTSEAAILAARGAKHGVKKIQQSLNKTDTNVKVFSEKHLQTALDLGILRKPEGGFALNIVYTGHPYTKDIYAPFARFHEMLFKEKQSEIVDICSALGASKLKVTYERQQIKASTQKFGINLPEFLGSAKSDNQNSQGRSQEIMHDATYKPSRKPVLPNHELIWYHNEPQWQRLVKDRLENGLLTIKLQIISNEDYYVNHELALGFEKVGLDLGGKWIEHTHTMLSVEGEFVPLNELPQ